MQATANMNTSKKVTADSSGIGLEILEVKQSVVKNDTASTNVASIKMGKLATKANVQVGDVVPPAINLVAMEKARISWEGNELAASNKRLYSILQSAYRYYLEWKNNPIKESRKARADELEKFMKDRKYPTLSNSHDMNRVVKCVFGVDRRRVSAYSIALREAPRVRILVASIDFKERGR